VIQPLLPPKFRPKLHSGSAIAGICLIRLEHIRPMGLPAFLGLNSENAAHRIAVVWEDENAGPQEGVFIPRRDTSSLLNQVAGGRLFPGEHKRAEFKVQSGGDKIDFHLQSDDGEVVVELRAKVARELPGSSKFGSMENASSFFEPGSLGYSVTSEKGRLDGVRLKTKTWKVEPLEVEHVFSSYFADEKVFPKGSAVFDCALLMRNIEHEWLNAPELYL